MTKDDNDSFYEDELDYLKDNLGDVVDELHKILTNLVFNDYFDGLINDKHLEAWNFFRDKICINYQKIYERWKKSPILFISSHMLSRNITPIVDLYNEAVRTYIFGLTIASVAMCRALLEHVLKKHYFIQGKDLETIIFLSEEKFNEFRNLKLQEKRRFANNILHKYKNRNQELEKNAFEFLLTLRYVVTNIPPPSKA